MSEVRMRHTIIGRSKHLLPCRLPRRPIEEIAEPIMRLVAWLHFVGPVFYVAATAVCPNPTIQEESR